MQQSSSFKCEKCNSKPATVKLTDESQEKRLCFQCERELAKETPYKDWNRQFISYKELKEAGTLDRFQPSKQVLENPLISPTQTTLNSYRSLRRTLNKDRNEGLSESVVIKSPISKNDFAGSSPRVQFEKQSYDFTASYTEKGSRLRERTIRQHTPKTKSFFSEYLKDYNYTSTNARSPSLKASKRELRDKIAQNSAKSPFGSPNSMAQTKKSDRTYSMINYESLKYTPKKEATENFKNDPILTRSIRSKENNVDIYAEVNKKYEDSEPKSLKSKKDEIKNKISKLAEKLYSPAKSTTKHLKTYKSNALNEIQLSKSKMIGKSLGRNYPNDFESKTNDNSQNNTDIKGLKAHKKSQFLKVESIEMRNSETVRQLKEELKQVKEELFKEKTENVTRNKKEIAGLSDKINDLERKLEQESSMNKLLKEELEQTKSFSDKKISDLREELERIRKEKDVRIEELSLQLKIQNRSNRETIDQIHRDNETFIKRLKNEHDLTIRGLTQQINNNHNEIDRLKQEKEEAIKSLNVKIGSLQESLKHYQDANKKLEQTLEIKNEEAFTLNKRLTESLRTRNSFT